ncbi:hypothetical protein Btru_043488 [Bulinus truncatus]|nr:hypothetical protein Btru_043488 [Bulinus truncatus]
MKRLTPLHCAVATVAAFTYFSSLTRGQNKTFHIGVLIPLSGTNYFGREIIAAANLGVQRANTDPSLRLVQDNAYNFSLTIKDTGCDVGLALYDVVELIKPGQRVDAIVGPYCNDACEIAGLLIGRFGLPMISYGCEESKLLDRQSYPTFLRTATSFKSMAGFLQDIMVHFGWTHLAFVTVDSQVWMETEAEIMAEFTDVNIKTVKLNIDSTSWQNMTSQLRSSSQYIFLLLMDGSNVLQLMKAANEVKLLDGQHVFIAVDYANMGKSIRSPLNDAYLTGANILLAL